MLEDGGQVPHWRSREGRIPQRRRLATDGEHMAWRGIGAEAKMVVTVRELLGEPTVEREDRVVVDLQRRRGVISHLVMYPRIPIVRGIGQRGRREQISAILNIGAPGGQGGKVEVRCLVFLHQNHDTYHGERISVGSANGM